MSILTEKHCIFASEIVPINKLSKFDMKKFSKFVLDVLPTLKMGRFSILLDGEVFIVSKEPIFLLAGASCVALQLVIPFCFD